jgi:CRISPR-associated protein Cas4
MFCLEEMWYEIETLWLYSMSDNRKYRIYKPSSTELLKFQELLEKYKKFDPTEKWWTQNTQKCIRCIYKELCDYYIWEVYPQLSLFEP